MTNAANDFTVIMLPATGTANPYRITLPTTGENSNGGGDLDVRGDMHIVGGGAQTTIVDGNQIERVFHVTTESSVSRLGLYDLTVQNGKSVGVAGGGIFAERPFTLHRVRLRANTAYTGGGIFVLSAAGFIVDSVLTENTVTGDDFSSGGALFHSTAGTVEVRNTTIALNHSVSTGAGIAQFGGGPTTRLKNVTLAQNDAESSAGIAASGTMNIRNSIVAGNILRHSGPFNVNPNCSATGTYQSIGFSLVFGGDTCGFSPGNNDIVNTGDPQLQPLALNGGSTESMALGGGSAAIDTGATFVPGSGTLACFVTDQRGAARPVDGDTIGGARCDIGAYEAAACTTRPKVSTGVAPGSGGRLQVTVTAGTGNIVELRLHPGPFDNIVYNVGAGDQTGERVVTVNAPTKTFTLKRANGTGAGTLKFDVVDGCNVWHTLAGGGPKAWPAVISSVADDAPADDAQRISPTSATTTPATTLPGCSPQRPNVGVKTVKTANGQYQTTLSAQTSPTVPTNSLSSIRIGSITNAAVTLNGSPVTPGQSVALPAGTRQATLTVVRSAADSASTSPGGVSLVVTDACGPWSTFVGFGTSD